MINAHAFANLNCFRCEKFNIWRSNAFISFWNKILKQQQQQQQQQQQTNKQQQQKTKKKQNNKNKQTKNKRYRCTCFIVAPALAWAT